MPQYKLNIDGAQRTVEAKADEPLLYALIDGLQFKGPKFGCGLAQCGYCANGWIMSSVALLEKNPRASEAQIRQALAGVQCRCGTHIAIMRAVKKAGETMAVQAKA